MQHPPAEGALDGTSAGSRGEAFLPGVLADDPDVDAVRGAGLDDAALVAAVRPGRDYSRVPGGQLADYLAAAGGVLHAGRGDQQDQQQAEGVGGDMPLAALDFLPGAGALGGF